MTAQPPVRLLTPDEHLDAARLVGTTMLGTTDPALAQRWVDMWHGRTTHGAVADDGRVVGVAQWFPSDLSLAGPSLPAACVTAVAVASTERRRGHLRRMMEAQLATIADADVPIALLVAAEWPIYGRYGYGPAIDACGFEIDAASARFRAPRTGTIEGVDAAGLRPHLEAAHDARWARTIGAVTRQAVVFDGFAGVTEWPGDKEDLGQRRGAIWRDDAGGVQGAVAYAVEEHWERNRPRGKASVKLLVGATAEAERELWRHLCEVDWIATVSAGVRGLDDPLPLLLEDARAATAVDRSDCVWARILDVPRVLGARRSLAPARAIVDVVDDLGFATGRWLVELSPEGADVRPTTETPDVRLPVAALGAQCLGGTSARRLHGAGWLDEEQAGGVDRLDAALQTATAPWSPTTF